MHGIPIAGDEQSFYLPNGKYIPLAGLKGFAGAQPGLDLRLQDLADLPGPSGRPMTCCPSGAPDRTPGAYHLRAPRDRYVFSPSRKRPEEGRGFGGAVRLDWVTLRCPGAIPATFDYFGARDRCGGLADMAAILVAMGAEVGGG